MKKYAAATLAALALVLTAACGFITEVPGPPKTSGIPDTAAPETAESALDPYPGFASAPTPDPTPIPAEYITIRGTEYSTALTEIRLNYESLTNEDIAPLREMRNLLELQIGNNNAGNLITDLSPLAGLTTLTHVYLSNNESLTDLSPLAGLLNLESLALTDGILADLSPLSGLTKLTYLSVDGNSVSDLIPLARLVNLQILDVQKNNISSLTPLAALTSLQELRLENNPVTDWSPVAHLDYVAGRPGETTVYG